MGAAHALLFAFILLIGSNLVDVRVNVARDVADAQKEQDIAKLKETTTHYIRILAQTVSLSRIVMVVAMSMSVATAAILLFSSKRKASDGK